MICTFLATLELLRLRHITAVQDKHFGEIVITKSDDEDPDDVPEALQLSDELPLGDG